MEDNLVELILSPEDHEALAADTHAAQEKLAELAEQLAAARSRNNAASNAISTLVAAGVTDTAARQAVTAARSKNPATATKGLAK